MDAVISRPVVVTLAILGAIAAGLASALLARGTIGETRAKQLNVAGYACMGASMLLFIVAGFRA